MKGEDRPLHVARAQRLIDTVWRRMADTFLRRMAEGRPLECFPDLSEAAAERTAGEARSALAEIDALDIEALPHELALTVKCLHFLLEIEAQALRRFWLVQHCGVCPAMFPTGPYGGGYLLNFVIKSFSAFKFSGAQDTERYLALVEDFGRLIDQLRAKLEGQAARGIRIPQPALPGMRTTMGRQADAARQRLRVDASRLSTMAAPTTFVDRLERCIEQRVKPAFAALLDAIDDDYAAGAPHTVGLAQFGGGERIYEMLVAEHLSMPMTVEAVHRAGLERMAWLEEEMAALRAASGDADRDRFHRRLLEPPWIARCEADLQAHFDAAIRRIEPHIDALFRFKPAARYRTERLDRTLEAGLTAGFYQPPMAGQSDGIYYYNASNVSQRTLATASSLIYHELIPGHHFHLASQQENRALHPLRQSLMLNAFNEGWAEYAATLAGEIGMYVDPCEHYGRLLKDAFYSARLVVDTGLNALGWPLERARQYLRDHTLMSEAEIGSETLRYSTDIPAQSLAYKLGEIKLRELRERMRTALGARFDIRDFHDIVLAGGALPLQVLEWHVERRIAAGISNDDTAVYPGAAPLGREGK